MSWRFPLCWQYFHESMMKTQTLTERIWKSKCWDSSSVKRDIAAAVQEEIAEVQITYWWLGLKANVFLVKDKPSEAKTKQKHKTCKPVQSQCRAAYVVQFYLIINENSYRMEQSLERDNIQAKEPLFSCMQALFCVCVWETDENHCVYVFHLLCWHVTVRQNCFFSSLCALFVYLFCMGMRSAILIWFRVKIVLALFNISKLSIFLSV